MGFNQWLPRPRDFDHPETALHACICERDPIRLRALLSTSSPGALNHLDDRWGSPLHVAIRYDDLDAVDVLLRAGADAVTQRDFRGMGFDPPAPMMLAIGLGRTALVQRLWQHAPPPETYANGSTARPYWSCVAHAVLCGQVDILTWLLGAWHRWSQEALGWALKAAARRLNFFCVELLLPQTNCPLDVLNEALRAAAVDTEYENAERPRRELCTAVEGLSQARIIRALIQKGADPNALSRDGQPLVTAAARYTERAVALRALLEGGANPNAAMKNGDTALHLLARPVFAKKSLQTTQKPHEVGIRLLLLHGASMYTKAARGQLPLHSAAFGGNMHIFQLYLSALTPGDQNHTVLLRLANTQGESLLHWAAAGGHYDMLVYLLSLDSNVVNDQTDNGWTPLLCALVPQVSASKRAREAMQAAQLLLAHGADARLSTAEGWTPLHCLALHRDTRPYGEAYALAKDVIARGVDMDARADVLLDARDQPWGQYAQISLEGATTASPWRLLRTGMTPLLLAADRGAFGVSRALMDSGADLSCRDDAGRDALQLAWRWRCLHDEAAM